MNFVHFCYDLQSDHPRVLEFSQGNNKHFNLVYIASFHFSHTHSDEITDLNFQASLELAHLRSFTKKFRSFQNYVHLFLKRDS